MENTQKELSKEKGGFVGTLEIVQTDPETGEVLYRSSKMKNRVVSSTDGYGRNLVLRHLAGDLTYSLVVDSAKIGTGTNTPADTDTDLQTVVLSGIEVLDYEFLTHDTVQLTFFLTDAELANGTYREFGIFSNGRLFARVLIDPAYTKSANRDTSFFYTIQLTATS